jgi:Family of unknown function (DUF6335)
MTERKQKPEDFNEEQFAATKPAPLENDVDAIAVPMGVEMSDKEVLNITKKLTQRDENRWELDRNSAEE